MYGWIPAVMGHVQRRDRRRASRPDGQEACVWTGGPAFDAQIVEAELAHFRAGGTWESYLDLEEVYRDNSDRRAANAAMLGFYFGVSVNASRIKDADFEPWLARAMRFAELTPISDEILCECIARRDRAFAECRRICATADAGDLDS